MLCDKAMVWLLVLFFGPLLFVIFHVVPAIIFVGLVFFWLFVLPHAGITRKNALIGTAVAVVVALGIEAYQESWEPKQQTARQQNQQSTTQPQGDDFEHRVGELVNAGLSRANAEKSVRVMMQNEAEAPPPTYRVYQSETDNVTAYIVAANTTDEQLKNLLWFFRKKVRAGAFSDIGITKPTSKNWGQYNYKAGMLLVYRGERCANEEFEDFSDEVEAFKAQVEKGGPCGYGEHYAAYYKWGFPPTNRDGFFDEGAVRDKNGDVLLVFHPSRP